MTQFLEWARLRDGRILYWVAEAGSEPSMFRIGAELIADAEGRRLLAALGVPPSTTHGNYFRA